MTRTRKNYRWTEAMIERLSALTRAHRWSETSLLEDAFAFYCGSRDPDLLERQKIVLRFLAKEGTKDALREVKTEAQKPTRPGSRSGNKSAR
jgi:hypothetical protein